MAPDHRGHRREGQSRRPVRRRHLRGDEVLPYVVFGREVDVKGNVRAQDDVIVGPDGAIDGHLTAGGTAYLADDADIKGGIDADSIAYGESAEVFGGE